MTCNFHRLDQSRDFLVVWVSARLHPQQTAPRLIPLQTNLQLLCIDKRIYVLSGRTSCNLCTSQNRWRRQGRETRLRDTTELELPNGQTGIFCRAFHSRLQSSGISKWDLISIHVGFVMLMGDGVWGCAWRFLVAQDQELLVKYFLIR